MSQTCMIFLNRIEVVINHAFNTYLNKIGHGKVHDVMSPCELDDNIGFQEIVTLKRNKLLYIKFIKIN